MAWRRSVRWLCSRSHGQPVGERSLAMTLSRSAIAEFFFIYDLRYTIYARIDNWRVTRKS